MGFLGASWGILGLLRGLLAHLMLSAAVLRAFRLALTASLLACSLAMAASLRAPAYEHDWAKVEALADLVLHLAEGREKRCHTAYDASDLQGAFGARAQGDQRVLSQQLCM